MNIAMHEPTKLRAGATWQWRRDDLSGDYPAGVWTLTYYCKGVDDAFNITAVADGTNFSVSVPNSSVETELLQCSTRAVIVNFPSRVRVLWAWTCCTSPTTTRSAATALRS